MMRNSLIERFNEKPSSSVCLTSLCMTSLSITAPLGNQMEMDVLARTSYLLDIVFNPPAVHKIRRQVCEQWRKVMRRVQTGLKG